jgi:chorismate dehydratase
LEPAVTVLGVVPYLNAVPLVEGLDQAMTLREANPGGLSAWLRAEAVDAALLPVAESLCGAGGAFLGRCGIASDGPVESVLAFLPPGVPVGAPSRWPGRVVLDPASRTSVALLRVLLECRYGLRPEYRVGAQPGPDPAADLEAMTLVIGDRALARRRGWSGGALDLGAEWTAWTGLPFVFARWTARRGLPDAAADALARQLDEAAERGLARVEELARRHGPAHGLSPAEAMRYLTVSVRHRIDERGEAGFDRFALEFARLGPLRGAP